MAENYTPVPGHIFTSWGREVTPENAWRQYPRPQMQRTPWLNLNGLWDYGITPRSQGAPSYEGVILVPFPLESALSGVKRPLLPDQTLWYRRTFILPEKWAENRLLLHFGAVDWETVVWINQSKLGVHRGGNLPFTFDITDYIQEGENEIQLAVWDPTDQHWNNRGKQVLNPRGIWYTAVSGIWQTVWLEPVPPSYIADLKLTPDIDRQELSALATIAGCTADLEVEAIATDGERQLSKISGALGDNMVLPIPDPHLWSPGDPHLYHLEIHLLKNGLKIDQVQSYFGMRKFSLEPDLQGRLRFSLNNQPLFQYGPLDQGYWPDGLYTPPSENAMRYDLEFIKSIGCNMVRKHVKVEPARYYYDCDRLGLIVWQDMPNGGKAVGPLLSTLAVMFSKFTRRDDRSQWRAGRELVESRQDYYRELREMVDHLHNFPSIGMWVPFNEAWGQFDARAVAEWLKGHDPTRVVDHASGWFDQGGGDFRSIHTYIKSLKPEKPGNDRAVILSEFGGYTLKLPPHLWDPQATFGYRKFDTKQALTTAYLNLLENQLIPWIERGLSAAVYTQTTDVETELNGFLTYDRECIKMDPQKLRAVHEKLSLINSN